MGDVGGGGSSHLPHGHIIGNRYRIIRPLGAGGMASVYLAEDVVLGETTVAIKVLRKDRHLKDENIQRFLREVRLTHKINHENVVRTFDFGQDGDTLFYTMEYLPGSTLDALLNEPDFPISRALSIAAQIMRGLSAIHSVGVLHRDLKPANIIMDDQGKLKIADFGIARGGTSMLTVDSGEVVGTITYIAPEMLLGEDATVAVDYYALGAIIYQLLTQRAPIDDEVPARLLLRKVEEAPRDPQELREDIPDWLARGLMGLLEVDPKVRMKAVNYFASNLDTYAPRSSNDTLVSNLVPETLTIDEVLVDKPLRHKLLGRGRRGTLITKTMLSVLVGMLVVPLSLTETSVRTELNHVDTLFQIRGEKTPRNDIVIVSVDEQSYSNLSVPLTSPWPRELHTKLLHKLQGYSPRRVVFDVIFADTSPDKTIDEGLAAAIGNVPTVLGAATGLSLQATINGSYLLEQLIRPTDILAQKAKSIGNVTFATADGRVRDLSIQRSKMFPDLKSLAEAASDIGPDAQRPDTRSLMNYYGPSRTVPTVPYYMVLSDENPLPADVFKDKIVFIGLNPRSRTGPSQREAFVTPFDSMTFGTEVHATATSNLLSKDWIRRFSLSGEVSLQAIIAATFSLLLLVASGYMLVVYLTAAVMGVLAIQYLAFLLGVLIPVVTPLAFGVFCGLLFRILLGNSSAGAKWRL
jgi:serine/threonine protein kinase